MDSESREDEVTVGEEREVESLRAERDQLAQALESRIVIEQAKGVLAERYGLTVDDAFLLLRASARSARVKIHELATQVVVSRDTPQAILAGLARDTHLRAIAMRERTEAGAARTGELHREHLQNVDRLTQWVNRPTARIRAGARSDAVDLASRLSGYRWYLIVPDEEHWELVVEYTGAPSELPADLRERIDQWLQARSLPSASIRLGDRELVLLPPARR